MDFDHVLLAHSKWKAQLRDAVLGRQAFDMHLAAKDDQCELGKWIYGEGKKYANLPEYKDLVTKHAAFHACLPKVVNQSRNSTPAAAAALLDPLHSEFGLASAACINAITALKGAVARG